MFNGCIYNYPVLKLELQSKGHEFISTCDTEVICEGLAEKNVSFEDSAGIKYTCNVISINTGNDLNNFDYNIGHPFR